MWIHFVRTIVKILSVMLNQQKGKGLVKVMLLVHRLKEVLPLGHNLQQVVFGEMLKKQMNLKINQIILPNLQETIAMKIQMILHVHRLPLRLLKME